MEFKNTQRGFGRAVFTDQYNQQCSLQRSSLATEDAIWLGVDVDLEGEAVHSRMHLTQAMVLDLLPALTMFAVTGELPMITQAEGDAEGAATRPLVEALERVTEHLAVWAGDYPEDRTSETEAAIYCARRALAQHTGAQ